MLSSGPNDTASQKSLNAGSVSPEAVQNRQAEQAVSTENTTDETILVTTEDGTRNIVQNITDDTGTEESTAAMAEESPAAEEAEEAEEAEDSAEEPLKAAMTVGAFEQITNAADIDFTASVTVVNNMDVDIKKLYLVDTYGDDNRHPDDDEWGESVLPAGYVLKAGKSLTISYSYTCSADANLCLRFIASDGDDTDFGVFHSIGLMIPQILSLRSRGMKTATLCMFPDSCTAAFRLTAASTAHASNLHSVAHV